MASGEEIRIDFQLTSDEARRARVALAGLAEVGPWTSVWVIAECLAGFLLVWIIRNPLTRRGIPGYIQGALAIVTGTAFVLAVSSLRRVVMLRPYSTRATQRGSTTAHLAETGFRICSPSLVCRTRWESLARIAQTPEFFVLYLSDSRAVVLPRRALSGDATRWLQDIHERREERTAREFATWGRRFPWG